MAGNAKDLLIRLLVDDQELDKVDKSKANFEKWNAGLELAAGGSAIALGLMGTAAIAAGGAAAGMDQKNDQLAASLGLTAEQAAIAGEAAAGAYGNAFGGSLEEVNAATESIIGSIAGMRDASVDELQGITEKVLTLSGGFEIEADRISQVVGQMMSTGLASSAEEGLDLLTLTLQQVPKAVREDVLDAVDEYGPFFANIGMDGEAAMSALVAASEKGMYGIDKTGDAVKEFSIRAADMSTASVDAYAAMGLSAEEMSAKVLAGGEQGQQAFLQVVDGILGIQDPVEQANAAIALFGTPLEDLGTAEIPQFLDALADVGGGLGEVSGAADSMAAKMGDNLGTQWTEVRRDFEMTAAQIGENFLPVLSDAVDGLGGFADWAAQNQGVVLAIGGVIGVLAGGIIAISTGMKIWAAVQAIQTAAQWANNAAWLASPVTWIILAIIVAIGLLVAAAIWLWQNWDSVIAWISNAWAGFMGWIQGVLNGFAGWWNGLWSAIGAFIGYVWQTFIINPINAAVNWLTSMIAAGMNLISTTWNNVWNGLGSVVRSVWNGVLGWVEGGVNGAIGLINGMIKGVNSVAGAVGIRIDLIPNVRLPRLATGGVTTGPMMAIIGDNPGGREYVEPVDQVAARLERVALAAAAGSSSRGVAQTRLHPDDMKALAQLMGEVIYPLIMSGAQRTVKQAFGG